MESFGYLLLRSARPDVQGAVQAVRVKTLRLVWVRIRGYSGRFYWGDGSNGYPEVTICESRRTVICVTYNSAIWWHRHHLLYISYMPPFVSPSALKTTTP